MATILFPTDFSHASDAALQHAEAIARQQQARLVILHVEEPPLAYGGGELYYGLPEPSSERIMKMLEDVQPSDGSLSSATSSPWAIPPRRLSALPKRKRLT